MTTITLNARDQDSYDRYTRRWSADARMALQDVDPDAFAGEDLTFPIVTNQDYLDALQLVHYTPEPRTVEMNIHRIGRERGFDRTVNNSLFSPEQTNADTQGALSLSHTAGHTTLKIQDEGNAKPAYYAAQGLKRSKAGNLSSAAKSHTMAASAHRDASNQAKINGDMQLAGDHQAAARMHEQAAQSCGGMTTNVDASRGVPTERLGLRLNFKATMNPRLRFCVETGSRGGLTTNEEMEAEKGSSEPEMHSFDGSPVKAGSLVSGEGDDEESYGLGDGNGGMSVDDARKMLAFELSSDAMQDWNQKRQGLTSGTQSGSVGETYYDFSDSGMAAPAYKSPQLNQRQPVPLFMGQSAPVVNTSTGYDGIGGVEIAPDDIKGQMMVANQRGGAGSNFQQMLMQNACPWVKDYALHQQGLSGSGMSPALLNKLKEMGLK